MPVALKEGGRSSRDGLKTLDEFWSAERLDCQTQPRRVTAALPVSGVNYVFL